MIEGVSGTQCRLGLSSLGVTDRVSRSSSVTCDQTEVSPLMQPSQGRGHPSDPALLPRFYLSCTGFPECRSAVWFPDSVLEASRDESVCPVCQPHPVYR